MSRTSFLQDHHHPHSQKAKDQGTEDLSEDYRPVTLTSVVMKSFELLALQHLRYLTVPLLDPLQFAYRSNKSVDKAVNMALHYTLQHLDSAGNYVRILFVDFSSAFSAIVPPLLQDKLSQLSIPDST